MGRRGLSREAANLLAGYEALRRRGLLLLALGVLLTAVLGAVCACLGATGTSPREIPGALLAAALGRDLSTSQKVILHLRLPRVTMAILAGTGLSVSGAAMQAVTRNPLVSPFTMGVSNAAAFGASLSIVLGIGFFPGTQGGTVLTAFLLAFLSAGGVSLISLGAGMTPEALVLTGIAVNYLFSAATSVIQYFADEYQLAAAVAWAFGSFNGAQWDQAAITGGLVAVSAAGIFALAPSLDLLASGDDETARSLGADPRRVRLLAGTLSVLATAAVISFTGVIGFVGLAGPHIARMLVGNSHRLLLPAAAVAGALLMLAADTAGRLILAPVMIPVGIMVSFLGVPVFVNLLLSRRKGGRD
jgi:iron complex transport system permease protein